MTQLSGKPEISISENFLQVAFSNFSQVEKGELKLFRPSNAKFDHIFNLQPSLDMVQRFDVSRIQQGMYKARMTWSMNGKEFYFEETIYR